MKVHALSYQPPNDQDGDIVEISDLLIDDVRALASKKFVFDDDFINTSEFKVFINKFKEGN